MSRPGKKPTTNEFYRSVLDSAVREQWQATTKKTQKRTLKERKRLSTLYGSNVASTMIRNRTKISSKRNLSVKCNVIPESSGKTVLYSKTSPNQMKRRASTLLQEKLQKDQEFDFQQKQKNVHHRKQSVFLANQSPISFSTESKSNDFLDRKLSVTSSSPILMNDYANSSSSSSLYNSNSNSKKKEIRRSSSALLDTYSPSAISKERGGQLFSPPITEEPSLTLSIDSADHELELEVELEPESKHSSNSSNKEKNEKTAAEEEDALTPISAVISRTISRHQEERANKKKRSKKKKGVATKGMLIDKVSVQLPPWYCGYKNSTEPTPSSPIKSSVPRYGFTGTLNLEKLKKCNNKIIDPTQVSIVNDYKKPLSGPPALWPKGSEYVTGSSLKEAEPDVPLTPHIEHWIQKDMNETKYFDQSIIENRKLVKQAIIETRILNKSLNNPEKFDQFGRLKVNIKTNQVIKNARRIKYWKGFTVINAKNPDENEIKELMNKRKKNHSIKLSMRWKELIYLYNLMKNTTGHRHPGLVDFSSLLTELKTHSCEDIDNIHVQGVTREQFVTIIVTLYENANRKHLNRLFSCFDLQQNDLLNYKSLMSAQRCLWKLNETSEEKLRAMWKIFNDDSYDGILSEHQVFDMILLPCSTDAELNEMTKCISSAFEGKWELAYLGGWHRQVNFDAFCYALRYNDSELCNMFGMMLLKRLPVALASQCTNLTFDDTQAQQQQQQQFPNLSTNSSSIIDSNSNELPFKFD